MIEEGTAIPLMGENGFWNFTPVGENKSKVLAGSYTGLVLLENKGTEPAPRWISTRKIKGFNLSVRYVE